jgi:hypothetical protein
MYQVDSKRFALKSVLLWVACSAVSFLDSAPGLSAALSPTPLAAALPKVNIGRDGRTFETKDGKLFIPFGVNYYRPGTGWAPQVWKKFDVEATRKDFAQMKELGVNCVRVFLSYGSFYTEPGVLSPDGLDRFDQFLAIAEEAGIYVHPTGPDHWEGIPEWARRDRFADEDVLSALESFWGHFATRYRGRSVIFAYDLLNEPEVRWDTPAMRGRWNHWLEKRYGSAEMLMRRWGLTNATFGFGEVPVPQPADAPGDQALLDYQLFRESVADEWTRRQVIAIKSVDAAALVTVGCIQWSVPALIANPRHYSAFRPARQAKLLDFLEVHFYPLERGVYQYRDTEEELRNLAYLECVVREVARPGRPVVIAEFGWYGGGKPTFGQGRHAFASEEQQAQWCRRVVETTQGLATGWLNWGLYDQPEATDCSQLTGLLTAGGKLKAWGRDFKKLASNLKAKTITAPALASRPTLDWERCITSSQGGNKFREEYFRAFRAGQAK